MDKEFFVGLDLGSDAVGYAVTDMKYQLLKYKGEPMWGTTVFEVAKNKEERRIFRTERRRAQRRKQRILLTQEIFAKEIAKKDDRFFVRIQESGLYRQDTSTDSNYFLFEDLNFSDADYHRRYPTIHHLIVDLMSTNEERDVRLVYLAVAWLMGHRGHFLNESDQNNLSKLLNFEEVYTDFEMYCQEKYGDRLWKCDLDTFSEILSMNVSIARKEKTFNEWLNDGKKFKDRTYDVVSRSLVIKLLAGGKVKPGKLFLQKDCNELDSISLSMSEEEFGTVLDHVGEDAEILLKLRELYDWALLEETLNGQTEISKSKVEIYRQHERDLKYLKSFVKKYMPEKYYFIFREEGTPNYVAYSGHHSSYHCDKEAFCTFLQRQVKDISVAEEDESDYEDMLERLETRRFMPKQQDRDNRVIPYQFYWRELYRILENAKSYLPFLSEKDEDGYSNAEKLLSLFEFKIPYYVGPLRSDSCHAWIQRRAKGKIYPWNFQQMVDLDATEQAFINRMTNQCTYLPGEHVMPESSLLYEKFVLLESLNHIRVNDMKLPVEVKQGIYELFRCYKRVKEGRIREFLIKEGSFKSGDILSGLEETLKCSLESYHVFRRLLENDILTEDDVEQIIKYQTYSEDKKRLRAWIAKNYPQLSEEDRKYILRQNFGGFGRFSKKFLLELRGVHKETGEIMNVLEALWETQSTLEELMSPAYNFASLVESECARYYEVHEESVDAILERMRVQNLDRRPIYRALAILHDIKKVTKADPEKIFVQVSGDRKEQLRRFSSRRELILERYKRLNYEDIRDLLEELEAKSDNELQSEALFLYFMQLGRCMYSNVKIDMEGLKTEQYNIDHIYPQSKIRDDSLHNKVLVLREMNAEKGNGFVPVSVQKDMKNFWQTLFDYGLISEEKLKRLMRTKNFSNEELQSHLAGQLVETRKAPKAFAHILQKLYPNTEIVCVKTGMTARFRKEFGFIKARSVNDLYHGKDAYVDIVCGNVYQSYFSESIWQRSQYSLKTDVIFSQKIQNGQAVIWNGEESLEQVRKVLLKNILHYTRYSFERKGSLFDQMPLKKGKGVIPRKANLPVEKYGGYNRANVTFFLVVKYRALKSADLMFMPVDLMAASYALRDRSSAILYARKTIASIIKKREEVVEILGFPLGFRRFKVNTMMEMDGYRMVVTGTASGKRQLIVASMESLLLGREEEVYIKKIENFLKKKENKIVQFIDPDYDGINRNLNLELYDILANKMESPKYKELFGANLDYLETSREAFFKMQLEEQAEVLMNILSIFKTGRTAGCDLTKIGGKKNSANRPLSANLSNWKKRFCDVRIIDTSATGFFEKSSVNLLSLF